MRHLLKMLFFWLIIGGQVNSVLAQEMAPEKKSFSFEDLPFDVQGFVHSRHGVRIQDDPNHSKDFVLTETRLQTQISSYTDIFEWMVKSDFVYDGVTNKFEVNIREANLNFNSLHWLGIKVGRQILTWGKGDMLFINDLFPKDWQSFFSGRELEYLKAPSDALKVSLYFAQTELNIIYTPSFDPDIFPTGERLSFFDGSIGGFRGSENILDIDSPNNWFKNDELNWRLRRNLGAYDLALYGYYGYFKSPAGIQLSDLNPYFPSLVSHGLSFEGNLLKGIFSSEFAWYHSPEDKDGTRFNIANSSLRYILGQSFDLKKEWNIAFQYYSEINLNYSNLVNNWPANNPIPNKSRNMITLRVGKNLFKQKGNISLFNFYGISEKDNYLRINLAYKITDDWKVDIGANIFSGKNETSFWNQFQYDSNLYLGIKWSY